MGSRFERVPLVGTGADPRTDVHAWLTSAPVCALVEAFAADDLDRALHADVAAERGSAAERLARLDAFTDRWDTRRGLERNQAAELGLTAEQEALVLEAAEALGMRGGAPLRFDHYGHVLMPGPSRPDR